MKPWFHRVLHALALAIAPATSCPAQDDVQRLSEAHRLQRAGRHAEALKILDGLGPDAARRTEVAWMKACSHFALGDLARARDLATETLALGLGRFAKDVLALLLQIDRQRGDDLAALQWAKALHAVEPDDAEWLLLTGDLLADAGSKDEAESAYRAVLRAQPARADVWVRLGNLGLSADDPRRAAEAYETAWWAGEQTSALAANLSGLWQRLGDDRAALLWLERSIALGAARTPDTDLRRAHLLLATGDLEAAEEAAARLAAGAPPAVAHRARDVLARAARARGDLATAARHWESVLAGDPEDVSVVRLLGKLFYTLQDHGSAAKYLERYVKDPRARASEEDWQLLLRSVVRAESGPEHLTKVLSAYVERFGMDAEARAVLRHCVDRDR